MVSDAFLCLVIGMYLLLGAIALTIVWVLATLIYVIWKSCNATRDVSNDVTDYTESELVEKLKMLNTEEGDENGKRVKKENTHI